MTESFSNDPQQWLKAQTERWQKLLQGEPVDDAGQWQQLFDNADLFSHLGNNLGEHQEALMQLVNSQSSRFTAFAESLLRHSETEPYDTDTLIDDFQLYLQQQCNELLMQQWNLPEPFASLIKSQPLQQLTEGPLRQYLEQLAATPDLGNIPFSNTQIRAVSQAIIDYQDALNDYLQQYDTIFKHATEQLKQALQQDKEIDSIRALHDLWVECYEKAYADQVFTAQYQTCHGRISNSLMRARQLAFQARDSKLQMLGFVTRGELDACVKQQHKMRKQIKEQSNIIKELKEQVTQLSDQIKRTEENVLQAQKSPDNKHKKTPS